MSRDRTEFIQKNRYIFEQTLNLFKIRWGSKVLHWLSKTWRLLVDVVMRGISEQLNIWGPKLSELIVWYTKSPAYRILKKLVSSHEVMFFHSKYRIKCTHVEKILLIDSSQESSCLRQKLCHPKGVKMFKSNDKTVVRKKAMVGGASPKLRTYLLKTTDCSGLWEEGQDLQKSVNPWVNLHTCKLGIPANENQHIWKK